MNVLIGITGLVAVTLAGSASRADDPAASAWKVGAPIVTYWAGPGYGSAPLTDAAAQQLIEGGWNLAWCREPELDVARRHGLRAQLGDPLLTPAALDDPAKLQELDALIARVRRHPALYSYFLTDEPSAHNFPALARLIAHLREQDPAHLAYVNLFPTYASNEQLGTRGDPTTAYAEYLRQFVATARPALLSYDHYQFAVGRDMDDYFLNLALVRRAALDAGMPFLNIVQACTWTPSMREPGESELRYLVYTSLAYGAQGLSYYVYAHPGHTPGIATADGQPTAVYRWLQPLNRDFAAIATALQPRKSLGVFHAGMMPPGSEPLPADSPFRLAPPAPETPFVPGHRVQGTLLGLFATPAPGASSPTHVLVVNLDYQSEQIVGLQGPGPLEAFDPDTGQWSGTSGSLVELHLPPGGGLLLRVKP